MQKRFLRCYHGKKIKKKEVLMTLPRNEYPRPQFERKDWINLNGEWSYTFDFSRSGDSRGFESAAKFDGKIIVPFCPESKLSGVGFTDFIEMMWYQREIAIPAAWADKKVLLHFGGVDYTCIVYIDGKEAGRHTGGVSPFTVDLSKFVTPGKSHNLVIRVEDYIRSGLQPHGKQSPWQQSRNCNYTRTTGIWSTVWMEAVNPNALAKCRILPDFDNGAFTFVPEFYQVKNGNTLTVTVSGEGKKTISKTSSAVNGIPVSITLDDPAEWNPESPFLYDITLTVKDAAGNVLDEVQSYAGLRKIHLEDGKFYLNNRPIFLRFVLDQGFYEDGLWTAPNDEALKNDIKLSMDAGFNGARLHQKIFDERFHYWADRMGYLTWAEFSDWGMSFWPHFFPKTNPDYNLSFRDFFAEWAAVVERDLNHPSIIAWTPFNETSKSYDIDVHRRIISDVYDLTRRLDPTRPVNDTSGYCHAKTDLWTIHHYAQDVDTLTDIINQEPVYMTTPEELPAWDGQPYIIDEYGGVSYLPEGRKPFAANTWGYNKEKLTKEQSEQRITDLTRCIVENPRMVGYCYTQLTDIEQEQNGIYNYDRTPKFDAKVIRDCFSMKPDWSAF